MSNNGALNARQEKFARLLAEGMPQSRAYIEAGYKARGILPKLMPRRS